MKGQDKFSAKVMLFGEYSILLGSPALSVPFNNFSASLRIPSGEDDKISVEGRESNRMLSEYYDKHLSGPGIFSDIIDLERFHRDLRSGLYLDSTIPMKYGVGSSGALCAAIYARYAFEPFELQGRVAMKEMADLRRIFIHMESWFHGKSSGLDPLVIYLRHPLIIREGGITSLAGIPVNSLQERGKLFLLDTGQSRGTATLVPSFLEHFSPQGDRADAGKHLSVLNRSCIMHLCTDQMTDFMMDLKLLSEFQLFNLSAMIPDHIQSSWSEGLESDLFLLKLCGSGGGGFLTGFTPDFDKTLDYFRKKKIPVISVDIDHENRI
jgi:mevalonate kinase